jgi:fructose-specific phosphotransferase system IIC component
MNSFSSRVILLLGLMALISLVDLWRNGARAVKYREYGFVLFTGVIAALTGFVNDSITSSISPNYFIIGKGLEENSNLRLQAAMYGCRAGFAAGVVGGAVLLYAARRKSAHTPLEISRIWPMLWMPLAGAAVCGVVFPVVLSRFDPAHFELQLAGVLSPEDVARFRSVWWIHVGLYFGMTLGLMLAILRALKTRRMLL